MGRGTRPSCPTPADSLEATLQKRALLLALFMVTSAFPGDTVTASMPELTEEQTEAFRKQCAAWAEC